VLSKPYPFIFTYFLFHHGTRFYPPDLNLTQYHPYTSSIPISTPDVHKKMPFNDLKFVCRKLDFSLFNTTLSLSLSSFTFHVVCNIDSLILNSGACPTSFTIFCRVLCHASSKTSHELSFKHQAQCVWSSVMIINKESLVVRTSRFNACRTQFAVTPRALVLPMCRVTAVLVLF
jgi:hypothetical protein